MWQFLTDVFSNIINKTVMKTSSLVSRVSFHRLRPVLRASVSVVLLGLLGMEILPLGVVERMSAVPGVESERTFRIEPLQVCDSGDSFFSVLFDLPVLLPGAPSLIPLSEALPLTQQAIAFVPDGFNPAIDRPPRFSA